MNANIYIGLFSLVFSLNVISQTYRVPENNSFRVSKYNNADILPDNGIRKLHTSILTDSAVINEAYSRLKLGIGAGTAIPAGEYASGGERGGYAGFGYSLAIKLLYDMDVFFIMDLTLTSNPFKVVYCSSCDVIEDSYKSIWCLFGFGVPVKLSPDIKIVGSLQIGAVLSRRPEIWVDNWRDRYERRQPRDITSVSYGADFFFLLKEHYSTGVKCLYAQTEYETESDAEVIVRPAVFIISLYFTYLF